MNLNQGALLKAAGIGAGVAVVNSIAASLVSLAALSSPEMAAIGVIGLLCCCIAILVYAGAGAAYGYFTEQDGQPVDIGGFALGGAIASAIAGVVAGLIGGILNLVLNVGGMMSMSQFSGDEAAIAGAGGVIGLFIGLCFAIVIGGILGAIGGAVYGLIRQNQSPRPTPPPAAV